MTSFFDNYLTYISVGFPTVEVLATACEALSRIDERKDSAGITSDKCQILPSSNSHIYTLSPVTALGGWQKRRARKSPNQQA
jgi:hypothetical protein